MNPSVKEIEAVSKLTPLKRYKYFIKKIADSEAVWTIVDSNNDFSLSKIESYTLISLWPTEAYIIPNLADGWKTHQPIQLSLEELEKQIFPIAQKQDYLFNIFSVNGKSGFIVSLEELIRDLNYEIETWY